MASTENLRLQRCLACSRNSKKASVARAEWVRRRVIVDKVREVLGCLDHTRTLGFTLRWELRSDVI